MEGNFGQITQKIQELKNLQLMEIEKTNQELTTQLKILTQDYNNIITKELNILKRDMENKEKKQKKNLIKIIVIFLMGIMTTLLIQNYKNTTTLEEVKNQEGQTFYKVQMDKVVTDQEQQIIYILKE